MLKSGFPGDPDFSIARFWEQPYHYVMFAAEKVHEDRRQRLHLEELPVAQVSSILANQSRDTKKRPKPFSATDFCFFSPLENEDLPKGRFGAAALKMIKDGRYPSWALFCYDQLISSATKGYEPEMPALLASDAILLHPVKTNKGYSGMLIAQESASKSFREFSTYDGETVELFVPNIHNKVIAEEDVTLTLRANNP